MHVGAVSGGLSLVQEQTSCGAPLGHSELSITGATAMQAIMTEVMEQETPDHGCHGPPAAPAATSLLSTGSSASAGQPVWRSVADAIYTDQNAQLHQLLQNALLQQLFGAAGVHSQMPPMWGILPPALSAQGNPMTGSGMPFGSAAPPMAFAGSHQPPWAIQRIAMGQTYASAHGHSKVCRPTLTCKCLCPL